jgi:hypothetical protein
MLRYATIKVRWRTGEELDSMEGATGILNFVVKFQKERASDWSVVANVTEPIREGQGQTFAITLIAQDAEQRLLVPGSELVLLSPFKEIGNGQVLNVFEVEREEFNRVFPISSPRLTVAEEEELLRDLGLRD